MRKLKLQVQMTVDGCIAGPNGEMDFMTWDWDGYLKNRSTYEIIDPKTVGVPETKLVLGKHSGRHALKDRCQALGFKLTKEELDAVYARFTAPLNRSSGTSSWVNCERSSQPMRSSCSRISWRDIRAKISGVYGAVLPPPSMSSSRVSGRSSGPSWDRGRTAPCRAGPSRSTLP